MRITITTDRSPLASVPVPVEWLLARHEQLTGVVCLSTIEFRDDAEEGLDPVRATAVFRCLQESLTNVVRHARASTMAVHLQRQGDELLLRVRDDGVGFCLDRGTPPGHYGLIGMRERALAVGGRLEVQTEPGSGTEIRLHIPLSPPLRERMEVAA